MTDKIISQAQLKEVLNYDYGHTHNPLGAK